MLHKIKLKWKAGTATPTPTPTETATQTSTPTATNTSVPPTPITIVYEYDDLYGLTEANYSTGDTYHYAYDAVGNSLAKDTLIGKVSFETPYTYEDNNVIDNANGIRFVYDFNINLTDYGAFSYTY